MELLEERILRALASGPMKFDDLVAELQVTPGELGGALQKLRDSGNITTVTLCGGGWKLV